MKKVKTKFTGQPPKFGDGGFMKFLESDSAKRLAGGMADAGGMFGSFNKPPLAEGDLVDDQYTSDISKANRSEKVSGGIGAVSKVASMIPGIGGLAAGAVGLFAKPLGKLFGGKHDSEIMNNALSSANSRKFSRDLDNTSTAGARNRNALPEYKAVPYGKSGMKLSKFSKPC